MEIKELGTAYVNLEVDDENNEYIDNSIENDFLDFIFYGGLALFEPLLKSYNKLFHKQLYTDLKVSSTFESLKNTDWWEQYMANSFQFSGTKVLAQQKILQSLLFDADHKPVSYSKFLKSAKPYLVTFNQVWLNVEMDLAKRGATAILEWNDIYSKKDIFPYWIYRTRGDSRVRDEHRALEGLKFRIDSKEGSKIFFPNGWNCRCYSDTTDDSSGVLTDKETTAAMNQKVGKRQCVPDMFQHNVAIDGIFPSGKYAYEGILPSMNSLNGSNFSNEIKSTNLETTSLTNEQKNLVLFDTVKHKTEVTYQNKKLKLNFKLKHDLVTKINHVQNLKNTIEHPNEVWMRWKNPNEQKIVLMNFITYDKTKKKVYIVETKSGFITDSYMLKHTDSIDSRRSGLKVVL